MHISHSFATNVNNSRSEPAILSILSPLIAIYALLTLSIRRFILGLLISAYFLLYILAFCICICEVH